MVSETVPSHGLVWSSPRHRGNADGPVVLDVNLTTCKKEMLSQEFNTLILGSKTEIIAEPRMWLETTLYNLFQGGGCYIYIYTYLLARTILKYSPCIPKNPP
jgi:hypothetical protein